MSDFTYDRANEAEIHHLPLYVQETLAELRNVQLSITARPLYKYMDARYAERMLDVGSVRIGTLDYYRQRETQDPLRGDAREGSGRYLVSLDPSTPVPAVISRDFGLPVAHGAYRSVHIVNHEHPNAFLYCMSRELSRRAAGGYDTCVEIFDVPGFVRELTYGLRFATGMRQGEAEVRVAAVSYGSRDVPSEYWGFINTGYVKENRFAVEAEVRAMWRDPSPGTQTFCDFSRPALKQYIRQVPVPDVDPPSHELIVPLRLRVDEQQAARIKALVDAVRPPEEFLG